MHIPRSQCRKTGRGSGSAFSPAAWAIPMGIWVCGAQGRVCIYPGLVVTH